MEKIECRIGICDDKQEDIIRIADVLKQSLKKTG